MKASMKQVRLVLGATALAFAVPMAYADTAGAAAYVAEMGDGEACAISPRIAAEL